MNGQESRTKKMSLDNASTLPRADSAAASPSPAESQSIAITVDHLTKRYGDRVAVRDLSFSVRTGEVFALLGPNGAGKTTTVEILEGYRVADEGAVHVLGLDPRRDASALKPRIGVMLQQDGLYPGLRAREILHLYASFFEHPEDTTALLDLVGLRDAANTRCRQLSGGQKRRLALAIALVGRPALLFLDEPTTGMDPQARRATWDIIRSVTDRGATVLLTTHFMDEAERLADHVAIIDAGQLIAYDTPAALTQIGSGNAVRFTGTPGLDTIQLGELPSAEAAREESPGVYVVETHDASKLLVELTAWLHDANAELTQLHVGHGTLEDVFLRLTGKDMRE